MLLPPPAVPTMLSPCAKSELSPYTQLALDVFAKTDTALKKVVKNTETTTAAVESGTGHVSRVDTEKIANACLAAAAEGLMPGMCKTADVALSVLRRHEEDDHVRVLMRKTQNADKWLNSHQRRWWHLKKRRMRNTEALERGTKELKGELQVLVVQLMTKGVAGEICRAVTKAIEPLSRDNAKPNPKFSARIETILDSTRKAIGAAMELGSSATIESLKTPLLKIQEVGTAFQAFIESYKVELWLLHRANSIQAVAHLVGSVLACIVPIVRCAGQLLVAAGQPTASVLFIMAEILEFAAAAVPKITALLLNLSTTGIRAGAGKETADQLAALVKEIERSCFTSEWCKHFVTETLTSTAPTGARVALVTLFLGANDAALPEANARQALPIEQFAANVRGLVAATRAAAPGAKVVVITPPPVLPAAWAPHCAERGRALDRSVERTREFRDACLAAVDAVVQEDAAGGGAAWLGVVDTWAVLLGGDGSWEWSEARCREVLSDGLHLSWEGNRLLAEAVLRLVRGRWPDELDPDRLAPRVPTHDTLDVTGLPASAFVGARR
ncbi:isoamyl acetate-hydrolyzing esterase [Cladochytrium tenue]|nr:isoamyl acetate-hydrolyzing esterase [Cladochytrium tenue]